MDEHYLLSAKDRKYCPYPGCENILLQSDGKKQKCSKC